MLNLWEFCRGDSRGKQHKCVDSWEQLGSHHINRQLPYPLSVTTKVYFLMRVHVSCNFTPCCSPPRTQSEEPSFKDITSHFPGRRDLETCTWALKAPCPWGIVHFHPLFLGHCKLHGHCWVHQGEEVYSCPWEGYLEIGIRILDKLGNPVYHIACANLSAV